MISFSMKYSHLNERTVKKTKKKSHYHKYKLHPAWQYSSRYVYIILHVEHLKPQDSFGRFVKNFLDLQEVDHTIRKHH